MRTWQVLAVVALAAAFGSGCGRTGLGLNGKVCVPGDQITCTGAGGCTGIQLCAADGSGYGACSCGVLTDGGGGGDGGGGRDGGGGGDGGGACSRCGTQACCDNICTNTSTDTNNCGQCGNACVSGPGPDCVMGICGCAPNGGQACSAGATCCGNGCKDLTSDTLNCGECGKQCTANHACQGGQCLCGGGACAATETCCGNRCVDTTSDRRNCGACGNQCQRSAQCVNGTCGGSNNCGPGGRPCPPGQQCCPNICCSVCLGGVCMDGHDAGT